MNANAKKWVEALRSGRYQQAQRSLRNNISNGFCCLGVACDLYRQEVGGRWRADNFDPGKGEGKGTAFLPPRVQEWLELQTPCGSFDTSELSSDLACRNDKGDDFAKIADIIEAEPEGLFV